MLKWIFQKQECMFWTEKGYDQMAGLCECGNGPWVLQRLGNFLTLQFLKQTLLQSQFVSEWLFFKDSVDKMECIWLCNSTGTV